MREEELIQGGNEQPGAGVKKGHAKEEEEVPSEGSVRDGKD